MTVTFCGTDPTSLGIDLTFCGTDPTSLATDPTSCGTDPTFRVHRAPGNHVVVVEWTTDIANPASWKEFPGWGAVHELASPAPGVYYFRAASKSPNAISDFTQPVSVVVT